MADWREGIKKVTPYIPGEQPKGKRIIKLNTNENPYPPSPKVKECIGSFDYGILRKYPEPNVSELRGVLAAYHGVKEENVFVGVGSDDVLALAFLTFFTGGRPLLFADITYSFYDVWAELYDIPYITIPLRGDFSLDINDYKRENGGIIIANPNAPTGLAIPVSEAESLVASSPGSVVIIDEAYVDFGAQSAISLTAEYDNLLVCRTFSKSRSLAGSRIGYAIGSAELIGYLLAVRNSFNSYTIDSLSSRIALASVEDDEYFKEQVSRIVKTRERSKERLSQLGFSFPDSKSNFIFATHKNVFAGDIFKALREREIYVRYFSKPLIDNYLRITVGTDEEMDILFDALTEII